MRRTLVGHELIDRGTDQGSDVPADGWAATGLLGPVRLLRGGGADRAAAALLAAPGPHVLAVLDLGTAPNGDTVVVVAEPPHALQRVLARGALAAGEAVTVLVPVVEALERLHAAGVAHGSLGVPAVRFDDAGAPVLVDFDAAVLRADTTEARFASAVAEDLDARDRLVGQVAGPHGPALATGDVRVEPAALVDALFAWAEPRPVPLRDRPQPPAAAEPPGRIIPLGPLGAAALDPPHEPPVLRRALPTDAARFAAGVRAGLSAVRPRVWLAAVAVVVALAAALVLLPGHGAAADAVPTAPASPTAPAVLPGAAAPSSRAPTAATRTGSAVDPEDGSRAGDPLVALDALLRLRAACLSSARSGCLREVDAADSPVLEQDAQAGRTGVPAVVVPAGRRVLRDRSGTTATVAAGSTTVLLVRQDDRWVLRDVVGPAG